MGILENIYVQNLDRIYYTFSAEGDVLIYEESAKPEDDEVIVISGLAKHIFLEMDGRRTLEKVIQQAKIKGKLDPQFEDEFQKDSIDFTKKLLASKLIVKQTHEAKAHP